MVATRRQMHPNQRQPADGTVRHSQLISTYGPGAMMDLVHDAVLIGGTDLWRDPNPVAIKEPRLRDTLAPLLANVMDLDVAEPFRAPPIGDDAQPTPGCGIRVYPFPRIRVCQNDNCRELLDMHRLTPSQGRRYHECGRGVTTPTVPVRFVATCPSGHISDFPWSRFVHTDGQSCSGQQLQLKEGATGDFSEIVVTCKTCGQRRQLSTALVPETLGQCDGHRPWLGNSDGAQEACEHKQRLLVRTASNSYFAKVASALSIPEASTALADAIQREWKVLQVASAETLPAFRRVPSVYQALANFPDDAVVLAAIEARRNNEAPPREPLRIAEFKQLNSQRVEKLGELPGPDDHEFFARSLQLPELPKSISKVVIASRLREVRVLVGFTRLDPEVPDLEGRFLDVKPAQIGRDCKWLPATEIRGEGVFLALDQTALAEWENRPAVQARSTALQEAHATWCKTLHQSAPLPFPGIRFYLLHSLSHLLLSAIALECGYAASALRERLYCNSPEEMTSPYAGILLSTGAASSEGTLGGLVEQGRALVDHLRRAWDMASLCSNDPGCASHQPHDELDERLLEGAACHGCLFVAECSCERFNNFLDRTLVAPAIGQPEGLAFFTKRP